MSYYIDLSDKEYDVVDEFELNDIERMLIDISTDSYLDKFVHFSDFALEWDRTLKETLSILMMREIINIRVNIKGASLACYQKCNPKLALWKYFQSSKDIYVILPIDDKYLKILLHDKSNVLFDLEFSFKDIENYEDYLDGILSCFDLDTDVAYHNLFIKKDVSLKLAKNKSFSKLNEDEEKTFFCIIGIFLELFTTFKIEETFKSQNKLIELILEKYSFDDGSMPRGLSRETLTRKFADSNKSLKSCEDEDRKYYLNIIGMFLKLLVKNSHFKQIKSKEDIASTLSQRFENDDNLQDVFIKLDEIFEMATIEIESVISK